MKKRENRDLHGEQPQEFYDYVSYAASKPEKKVKTGKIVFICVMIFALLVGVCTVGALAFKGGIGSGSAEKVTARSEDTAANRGEDNSIFLKTESSKALEELPTDEIVNVNKSGMVQVEFYVGGELYESRSGFVVGTNDKNTKTYIATFADPQTEFSRIKVIFNNNKKYSAVLIGRDARTNVCVLAVKKTGFKPVKFGSYSELLQGEKVISMGAVDNGQYFGSVSQGAVSSVCRKLHSNEYLYHFNAIQHDASVNSGNCGGALFNRFGQVVGLNFDPYTYYGDNGIYFAVPSNLLVSIINDLVNIGEVERASLLIYFEQLDDESAEQYNLPSGSIVISQVQEKSDLKGKVKQGDIIVAVNGEKLTEKGMILDVLDSCRVGEDITLKIARIDSSGRVNYRSVKCRLMTNID